MVYYWWYFNYAFWKDIDLWLFFTFKDATLEYLVFFDDNYEMQALTEKTFRKISLYYPKSETLWTENVLPSIPALRKYPTPTPLKNGPCLNHNLISIHAYGGWIDPHCNWYFPIVCNWTVDMFKLVMSKWFTSKQMLIMIVIQKHSILMLE